MLWLLRRVDKGWQTIELYHSGRVYQQSAPHTWGWLNASILAICPASTQLMLASVRRTTARAPTAARAAARSPAAARPASSSEMTVTRTLRSARRRHNQEERITAAG